MEVPFKKEEHVNAPDCLRFDRMGNLRPGTPPEALLGSDSRGVRTHGLVAARIVVIPTWNGHIQMRRFLEAGAQGLVWK